MAQVDEVTAQEVRFCEDAAGLAHGPWRVYLPGADPERDLPQAEGQFERGSPHGAFTHRYIEADPAATDGAGLVGPVRFLQAYLHGERHGQWQERAPDGTVLAEQHYRHGQRCGTWLDQTGGVPEETVFTACEALAEPEPVDGATAPPERRELWDGLRCPQGEPEVDEAGAFCRRGDRRHGPSIQRAEALEIVGAWTDGAPDGRFVAFLDGRPLRAWTWRAGALDGPFERWHPSGRLAERGAHAAGRLEGDWATWSALGHRVETGSYRAGLRQGRFERWAPGGSVVERVEYAANLRVGPAETYYDDGAPECSGAYTADRRTGVWRCLHPNGALRVEGPYRAGSRDGDFTGGTVSGALRFEGAYVAGEPVGAWRFYSDSPLAAPDDGRVVLSVRFEAGQRTGAAEARWVEGAGLHATYVYREDLRHGPSQLLFRSGQVAAEGDYVVGALHGPWRLYHPSGQLAVAVTYDRGNLAGPYTEYDPTGQVVRQGSYVNGRFVAGAGG